MATRRSSQVRRLKVLLSRIEPEDLTSYHRAGQCVEAICPIVTRAYGDGQMARLSKSLGGGSNHRPNLLLDLRKFASVYTLKEVKALQRSRQDWRFSWSHIRALCGVEDQRQRRGIQRECQQQQWPVRKLREEIHVLQGGKKSQGGRRPKDYAAGLQQLIDHSREWLDRYEEGWFHPDHGALIEPVAGGAALRKEALNVLFHLLVAVEDASDQLSSHKIRRKRH